MSKRIRILIGVVVIVAAVTPVTLWLIVPQPRVTVESIERIIEGMPLSEVERLLGKPYHVFDDGDDVPQGCLWRAEDDSGFTLFVELNVDQTVKSKHCMMLDLASPTESWFDRLRWYCGLR
jgi:hypothetical protein